MKQSSILILISMLMSTVNLKARDYDISVNNAEGKSICYKWINNKTELSVCYYSLQASNNTIHYYGDLNIPESAVYKGKTYPVTSIGAYAFSGCSKLTTVNIPASVTSIDERAFKGCLKLSSVSIPLSVISIGASAFEECSDLISIILPHKVTTIGESAFKNCSNLKSINIPQGITKIETNTFTGCSSLSSINIPKSLTFIGVNAFQDCKIDKVIIEDISAWCNIQFDYKVIVEEGTAYAFSRYIYCTNPLYNSSHLYIDESTEITTLEIPEGITEISACAFSGCAGIKEVKFPNSLEKINNHVFYNCSGLSSVNIPKNVTSIGYNAFSECNSLNYVELHCSNPYSAPSFSGMSSIKTLIIGDEVKYLTGFDGCTGLTSINIPNSVTSIGHNAFSGCTGLTSITIPSSVTTIGDEAFNDCTSLSSVTLLNSTTSIGKDAFSGTAWYNNQSDGIIYLGKIAYKYKGTMPENAEIEIKEGTEIITPGLFSNCNSHFSVIIPNSMTSISNEAFYGCGSLTSISFPNSLTSIGWNAFQYCTGLTTISIPNSVTSIGNSAFDGCSGLTSVHITDLEAWCKIDMSSNPLNWAHHLFLNGEEVTNLIIPSGVKSLTNTFSGCNGLTSVTIPNSVTDIGYRTFYECSNLTSVTIPNSVTNLGFGAFWGCSSLTSATISNNVKSIGGSAFNGCCGLTSITIPNSVTSIGDAAFSGCSALTSITISNNVTSIGLGAFSNCSGLTSITIPNSVTSIGNLAFSNCIGLTSVIIPNSVNTIGTEAFLNCSGLITASISNNVTKIPIFLFRDCTNLTTVYLGKSVVEVDYDGAGYGNNPWGKNPFRGCNNLQNVIIASDVFPKMIDYNYFTNIDNCRFIMKQSTYDAGIPSSVKNYATYSGQPLLIELKSKGATSAVFDLCFIDEDGFFDEQNAKTISTLGLTPGQQLCWKLDEKNYGILSEKANETITLTVQEPKALSTKKARLLADVEEEADDAVHFGFEWRRYDAPDGIPSSKVSAPLFNGKIVGTLSNLKDDVYYKYRPFYKSDAGEMYYGEWMGLFTGDADVFFEPEVYTKDATDITKVSALLAGIWIEGTEDIEEKGFEYWTIPVSKTRAVGCDIQTVIVTGKSLTSTVEGLKSGTEYGFRSYIKTASGTTYGEEKSFKTILVGDVNGDGVLDKKDLKDLTDHIMGNTPADFNIKKADINEDKEINAIDIVYLVNLINLAQ